MFPFPQIPTGHQTTEVWLIARKMAMSGDRCFSSVDADCDMERTITAGVVCPCPLRREGNNRGIDVGLKALCLPRMRREGGREGESEKKTLVVNSNYHKRNNQPYPLLTMVSKRSIDLPIDRAYLANMSQTKANRLFMIGRQKRDGKPRHQVCKPNAYR